METDYPSGSLLRPLEESGNAIEKLLDELACDADQEFARLAGTYRHLVRDRLLHPDMRDMSADVQAGRAGISPEHRALLKSALSDHDLTQRMREPAGTADRTDWNAAWKQFEERYRRLIYFRINSYNGLREFDDSKKQDVVQAVLLEMIKAAPRYDARQASLNTFVTVVANRVCCRFIRDQVRSPQPLPDDEEEREEEVEAWQPDPDPEHVMELYDQAMRYHDVDPASKEVYHNLLELKLKSWSARAIAERINADLHPSPALNENAVNQRWNILKHWMMEEHQREELFEAAMASHGVDQAAERVYRRILYLKLRSWPDDLIAGSCTRDLAPAGQITEKIVQQRWTVMKKWMDEKAQWKEKGEDPDEKPGRTTSSAGNERDA